MNNIIIYGEVWDFLAHNARNRKACILELII